MEEIKSDFVGVAYLTKYLNLSKTKIYELIKKNNLPCYKFSKNYRFKLQEIDEFISHKKLQ
ncbi:MAG: helix-turn-helix domain-containing protein [bacterium]